MTGVPEPDLFTWRPAPGEESKFDAFDRANPGLWEIFVRFTVEKTNQGFKNYGARDVLHRIRWESEVSENGESGFKINNIWSPWYARKFHRLYPRHTGFFRTREAKADFAEAA